MALDVRPARSDLPPGVLATDEAGTAVGWCAVAPRSAYPRVVASPNWRGGDPEVASADLYRGPLSVYLDAGFKEISRTSPSWVLVGLAL